MTNDVWAFGGCMQVYPFVDPGNIKNLSNYVNCVDQGGGGLGGGFMQQNDGYGACGNWTIVDSKFLFNLKTNIDFLHCDGTGTFNMYRSISEGSSGEALKLHVLNTNVEESQLISDSEIWSTPQFQAILAPYNTSNQPNWFSTGFVMCRGGGRR